MKTQTGMIAMAMTLAALTTAPAGAAQRTWANVGTDYNTAANWGGVLPGTGDYAWFPNVITNQPELSANITNQQVQFGGSGWILSASGGAKLTLTSTGSGATAGTGAAIVGYTFSNTIAAPIVLGATAGSTQRVNVGNSTGPLILSGNISEKTGPVALELEGAFDFTIRLAGTNTFSGGLRSVNGPILELGSSEAVPASGTFTIGQTSRGSPDLGGRIRSADNFIKRITIPFLLYADPVSSNRIVFGDYQVNKQGSIVFSGAATLLSDSVLRVQSKEHDEPSAAVFEGPIGDDGLGRDLIVGGGLWHNYVASAYYRGYAFLLGTNTYSGKSVLFSKYGNQPGSWGGACVINSIANAGLASSLGAGAGADAVIPVVLVDNINASHFAQGTLRYIGTGHSTDRALQYGPSAGSTNTGGPSTFWLDASGSGALTWNADMVINTAGVTRAVVLTGTSTNENTFAGAIPAPAAGNSSLTKDGRGTWTLKGANTFNGGLTVNSGRLVLDYTNNTTIVPATAAVTLGGGTLELRGKTTGSSVQTVGTVTTTDNTGPSVVRISQNGGAGTALTTAGLTRGSTPSCSSTSSDRVAAARRSARV